MNGSPLSRVGRAGTGRPRPASAVRKTVDPARVANGRAEGAFFPASVSCAGANGCPGDLERNLSSGDGSPLRGREADSVRQNTPGTTRHRTTC